MLRVPRLDGGVASSSLIARRPPGLAIDSGGLAKGLFADLIAERMRGSFAVDCGGDLRFGGAPRRLEVTDPFGGSPLHVFEVRDGAVATSGIGRRSWLDARGRPAHHLLDPATGRPAFTGVVQATALAPTAVEAEWRAKAARAERRPRLARPRRRARARRRNHDNQEAPMIKRRIAALGAAGAIAFAAIGCGAADSTTTVAEPSNSNSRPGRPARHERPRDRARRLRRASLQAAMEKLRERGGSPR